MSMNLSLGNKKAALAAACLGILVVMAAKPALAERSQEELISNSTPRTLNDRGGYPRGADKIRVMEELNVRGRRSTVNSVVVVASSRRGNARVNLVANGQLIDSRQLTDDLQ